MIMMKYNPGFLTDDELIKSFCIRIPEFTSIIEMLRECDRSSNPHRLVIGPRGYGKTNLLLRVVAEIHRNPELSLSFFPIVFAEESYRVSTADEFWLEALSLLAEQAPSLEDKDDLRLTFEELRRIHNDRTLGKRCLGHLLDFSNRHGKRLVLIVENLNMMFRDMAEQDGGWKLRQTLQTEPKIILLASATSRFSEISKPDHAFYDLFVTRILSPLSTEECATLWENVSGQCRSPEAMRGLRILTGGNPRLLSIVAQFGTRLSFRDLMSDLLKLIDDLTEYFKNHIEALPPQERRAYLALAELWEPATAREVAVRARLDTNKCSAHLNRLVDRGVVEIVGGGVRKKLYYLVERLYNIYYLLRRSRTPAPLIEALIHFMDAYYSPPELKDVGSRMVREASGLEPERKTLHWTAFARLIDLPVLASYRKELLSIAPEEFTKNFWLEKKPVKTESTMSTRLEAANLQPNGDISEQTTKELEKQTLKDLSIEKESSAIVQRQKEDVTTATGSILHYSEDKDSSSPLEESARATVNKGISFIQMHNYAEAVVTFEEVVRRFGSSAMPTVHVQVARALINKGLALGELNQLDSELAAYEEVVHRFSDSSEPTLLSIAANAVVRKVFALGKWEQLEEAISACDELVGRFGDSSVPQVVEQTATAYFLKGIKLGKLNRLEEAITVYDKLVARFGNNDAPMICALVAVALNNKASIFNQLNQLNEELSVYDEVIRRFGDSDEPLLIEQLAKAVLFKGATLDKLNRPTEAIAVYDEIVKQFGDSDASAILEVTVAQALFDKGRVLNGSNRLEESIAVCDEIVQRFANSGTAEILETAAQALFNKSSILGGLSRFDESIAVCDEIVQRFGDNESPEIQKIAVRSLFMKSDIMLTNLNRPEEAIVACDEAVRRFCDSDVSEILEVVAKVLVNKSTILRELNRPEEAIAICDEIMHRFGDNELPEIQGVVAHSIFNKNILLSELNRFDESIAVCDEIVQRFGDNESPEIQEVVALSLFKKGGVLSELNRSEEAAAICDEIMHRFGDNESPEFQKVVVARSLVNKSAMLVRLNRFDEAIAICDEIMHRFGDNESPELQEAVARSLFRKGGVLTNLNRPEEAIVACDEAVRRFCDSDVSEILEVLAQILVNKTSALIKLNRLEDAVVTCNEVIRLFGSSKTPAILEAIAQALTEKAVALIELNRLEDAVVACDEVVQRFGTCDAHVISAQVAYSLVFKGSALKGLDQIQEAKMAWEEVVKRFGVSETAELNSAVETAFLEIADSAREQGNLEEAIKAVGQLFDRSNEQISSYRCEGYLIRAQASVAAGNVSQAERDIKEALALLPGFEFLLSKTIDVLMDFTVLQGAIHTNELIQASPSAEQLLPFTIALDKELGNKPRVAREIEEIAEDILEDLGKRRKTNESTNTLPKKS